MKKFISYILSLISILIYGCEHDINWSYVSGKPYELRVFADSELESNYEINSDGKYTSYKNPSVLIFRFTYDESEQIVHVKSLNVAWKINVPSDCSDWLEVSPAHGSADANVKILVHENGPTSRNCELILESQVEQFPVQYRIIVEQSMGIGGYSAVDLGLPSGILWSDCNVGAFKPEEYGSYFAWGETTAKTDFSGVPTLTYGKTIDELKELGFVDDKGNLMSKYDAATVNMGSSWRTPNNDEIIELMNRCSDEWISLNGVNGRKLTGPNGNYIFLPACGYYDSIKLRYLGYEGFFMSATPDDKYNYRCCALHIDSEFNGWFYGSRSNGYCVRAVCDK